MGSTRRTCRVVLIDVTWRDVMSQVEFGYTCAVNARHVTSRRGTFDMSSASRRTCRAVCSTSSTWAQRVERVVSCRDVTWRDVTSQVEFGLIPWQLRLQKWTLASVVIVGGQTRLQAIVPYTGWKNEWWPQVPVGSPNPLLSLPITNDVNSAVNATILSDSRLSAVASLRILLGQDSAENICISPVKTSSKHTGTHTHTHTHNDRKKLQ